MSNGDRKDEPISRKEELTEEEILAYWTKERMRRAKPIPLSVPEPSDSGDEDEAGEEQD